MSTTKTTLVLGGTGKTGRRIVDRLRAMGVTVRVGSRSEHPSFDWEDRATWAPALQGVDAAYISYYPDLAVPGATDAVRAFTEEAKAAGVTRLVLLSGRGEEEAQAAEQVVLESGIDSTCVRASWFNQNFNENYMLDSVIEGELVLPVGDVAEPFVDADDIADVAVAALTEDGHVGQIYEVTGPRLLTFAEAIGEISTALDRPIRYVQIPAEDYVAAVKEQGLPEDLIELLMYLFVTVLDGRNAYLADGVERALGRKPRDFYDFAWDAAQSGVWNVKE
jgi:uncharacterized protein YbjT (DUF2867 family)